MVQLKAETNPTDMTWPGYQAHLFDAHKVAYSTALSFLAISVLDDGNLYLRQLRGGDERNDAGKLVKLELTDEAGQLIPAAISVYPIIFVCDHELVMLPVRPVFISA